MTSRPQQVDRWLRKTNGLAAVARLQDFIRPGRAAAITCESAPARRRHDDATGDGVSVEAADSAGSSAPFVGLAASTSLTASEWTGVNACRGLPARLEGAVLHDCGSVSRS